MSALALRERLGELASANAEIIVRPLEGALQGDHLVRVRVWLPGRRHYVEMRGTIRGDALADTRQREVFAEAIVERVQESAEDAANRLLGLPSHTSRHRREPTVRRARLRAERDAMMQAAW